VTSGMQMTVSALGVLSETVVALFRAVSFDSRWQESLIVYHWKVNTPCCRISAARFDRKAACSIEETS
jgi:hypothetical protein